MYALEVIRYMNQGRVTHTCQICERPTRPLIYHPDIRICDGHRADELATEAEAEAVSADGNSEVSSTFAGRPKMNCIAAPKK